MSKKILIFVVEMKQTYMNRQEILNILKEGADFSLDEYDGHGFGSIGRCPQCKDMTNFEYCYVHYPKMKNLLESLPWNIVGNPRNPKPEEYPSEDGVYITMMDCNEHEVCTNIFKDGNFSWMNRTHIKWWLKLPED